MEKAFKFSTESRYYKDLVHFNSVRKEQSDAVFKFLSENGIKSTKYNMGGNGGMNCAFTLERSKKTIRLSIVPADDDKNNFGKSLCIPSEYGLCKIKSNSKLGKAFQDYCIANKVPINLWEPKPSDYFKSIGWRGCTYSRIFEEDAAYIKIDIEHDWLEDDIPEGAEEIKLSEFHLIVERIQEEEK